MVAMNQIGAAAYNNTQKLLGTEGTLQTVADTKGQSFADLLESGLNSMVDTQKKAEKLGQELIQGKADINDVVLATQEADMVLTTVSTMRDKVVQAYRDILAMAI